MAKRRRKIKKDASGFEFSINISLKASLSGIMAAIRWAAAAFRAMLP